jgi:hypothetical protein
LAGSHKRGAATLPIFVTSAATVPRKEKIVPTDFWTVYYWADVSAYAVPALLLLAYVIYKETAPLRRVSERA